MPSNELHGLGVWLTRPAGQQLLLQQLVEEHGGTVYHYPLIEIEPLDEDSDGFNKLKNSHEYDLVIFVSQNAVRFACADKNFKRDETTKIGAIGAATASKLAEYDISVDYVPQQSFDSESFLNLFAENTLYNKKVLIVRGVGGREFLAEELKKRGASVAIAELYKRCQPVIDLNKVLDCNNVPQVKVIILSSKHALMNLVELAEQQHTQRAFELIPVIIHPRLQPLCKQSGFIAEPLVAEVASDQAMLYELIGWYRQQQSVH